MNSEYYNMPFENYKYNNQTNSDSILSDKYPSSYENNSLFSDKDMNYQQPYDLTEEFYKLHLLKLQNEKMTYNKYNINEQNQNCTYLIYPTIMDISFRKGSIMILKHTNHLLTNRGKRMKIWIWLLILTDLHLLAVESSNLMMPIETFYLTINFKTSNCNP